MDSSLPSRDVVLVGAGHTNAHVLRMWRMDPIPDARLTVVSPFSVATYSGMLPGTLAGLYPTDAMNIDLHRLTAACGARLIVSAMTGLDPRARRIELADRPPLPYDVVSIGIGSVPTGQSIWRAHADVLSVKPMQTFLARLEQALARVAADKHSDDTLQIAVVGAGAGGVEVTFCLHALLNRRQYRARMTLVDAGPSILRNYAPRTISLATRELTRRNITLSLGDAVSDYRDRKLVLQSGRTIDADLVIWCAGAAAPPVLEKIPLPKSDDGFLAARLTLQSTGDDSVFVVGDTATLIDNPVPKAGVYAVREGRVLWENIRRAMQDRPLTDYEPQRGFLSILCTGDERAIAQYKGRAFHGKSAWKLKDHIDRKFMRKYQHYEPMTPKTPGLFERAGLFKSPRDHQRPPAMRCRGCGGKIGSNVLAAALARLEIKEADGTVLGLNQPDDAALLDLRGGSAEVLSVDFFQPFLDDPYLVGRIAALNALSDLWAMGSRPIGAMTIATVPEGRPKQQAELLYQLLAGGVRELSQADATLLGGHTTESNELTIGYSVVGTMDGLQPFTKGNLQPGDLLILTKPLGTGTLLAAHMRLACRAEWLDAMIASMLVSNAAAARIARAHDITAATDITGFGLAGHLFEMLEASGVSARLNFARLPLLAGFAELSQQGIRSTLDEANREISDRISCEGLLDRDKPEYNALFDPQTSGGLLIAAKPSSADTMVDELRAAGYSSATIVGEVNAKSNSPRLTLASDLGSPGERPV